VTVKYVDSSFNASAVTTDYKMVTVCTKTTGINSVCLNTLFTNR
jgi:hypothetical protein